jgi:hypothetical protein
MPAQIRKVLGSTAQDCNPEMVWGPQGRRHEVTRLEEPIPVRVDEYLNGRATGLLGTEMQDAFLEFHSMRLRTRRWLM